MDVYCINTCCRFLPSQSQCMSREGSSVAVFVFEFKLSNFLPVKQMSRPAKRPRDAASDHIDFSCEDASDALKLTLTIDRDRVSGCDLLQGLLGTVQECTDGVPASNSAALRNVSTPQVSCNRAID